MDVKLTELPWLERPPAEFRQQVRELVESKGDSRGLARRLATYYLSGSQLHTLGVTIGRLDDLERERVRLGVLSNATTDLVLPALTASALRHGIWLEVVGAPFNQVAQEALDPASHLNRLGCEFVLLALDHRGLPLTPTPGDLERGEATVAVALEYIGNVCRALHAASRCTAIVQTVPQIAGCLFGSIEREVPGTLQWLIDRLNRELRRPGKSSSDILLLDVAALAETVGLTQWDDPVSWAVGKFAFAYQAVPLYADWVGRLIAAARGASKKCLVLDLDNTLWGGVVGDDGLSGIVLGSGDPVGEAYLSVQRTALALRERGVILAVSSKNDADVARAPFLSHPEMLLKLEHIAVFQANWHDKGSNLEAIAAALSLGVDSLVLLDDNPAERAQVRTALPSVAVPELPGDPAYYSATLLAAGYFEAIRFTPEDRQRAGQYQSNAARAELQASTADLSSYLRSLEMQVSFAPFEAVGRTRIAQLVNKTNQFNLTTRRYTESQIEAFEHEDSGLTLQVRLVDRFGDSGMISVVICLPKDDEWVIDTWLMSCRVLNRGVERATLNYIVARAKAAGINGLLGEYIETARNAMVRDHYSCLGFEPLESKENRSLWNLDVRSYVPARVPMAVGERTPMPDRADVLA